MQLFYEMISMDAGPEKQHQAAYQLLEKACREIGLDAMPAIAHDQHGKPFFPARSEIHFNLSHCCGGIACVISSEEVGVDMELVRPLRKGVLRRSFSAEEAADVNSNSDPDRQFFCYWTLKESFVKAIGVGISYPLNKVNFQMDAETGEILSNQAGYIFTKHTISDGKNVWILAVCEKKS